MRVPVDAQLGDLQELRLLGVAATEHGVHPQNELADTERLHEVVVGPELEADDAIDLLALRRDHDDRNVLRARFALEGGTHGGARAVRQHEIEQNDVRQRLAREAQSGLGRRRRLHSVPRLREVVLENFPQVGLVLDEDYACHGHRTYGGRGSLAGSRRDISVTRIGGRARLEKK